MTDHKTRFEYLREQLRATEEGAAMLDELKRLRIREVTHPTELDELRGIVAKLPKTADGVPVAPGDTVFADRDGSPIVVVGYADGHFLRLAGYATILKIERPVYSTREAEIAAKKENSDGTSQD